jgi:hypothetical protein
MCFVDVGFLLGRPLAGPAGGAGIKESSCGLQNQASLAGMHAQRHRHSKDSESRSVSLSRSENYEMFSSGVIAVLVYIYIYKYIIYTCIQA